MASCEACGNRRCQGTCAAAKTEAAVTEAAGRIQPDPARQQPDVDRALLSQREGLGVDRDRGRSS